MKKSRVSACLESVWDFLPVGCLFGVNILTLRFSYRRNHVAMIKIAGTKSNDKINFKEFVDFFYKVD